MWKLLCSVCPFGLIKLATLARVEGREMQRDMREEAATQVLRTQPEKRKSNEWLDQEEEEAERKHNESTTYDNYDDRAVLIMMLCRFLRT